MVQEVPTDERSTKDSPVLEVDLDDGRDDRETLHLVTQETRFGLIIDILGHPEQLPSLKELSYVNPSKSKSTIRNHLEKLEEYNVVQRYRLDKEDRTRDLPSTFYGLTPEGRSFLKERKLLRGEQTYRELYNRIEKTDQIKAYENAPRPDVLHLNSPDA
jgi:DNA-binding PadR family transcriptional regulator